MTGFHRIAEAAILSRTRIVHEEIGSPRATLKIVEKPLLPHWIIVGAGIAGLRAALTLATAAEVTLITKEVASESNTHYAQGGIAVAMGGSEDVHLHENDTIVAGDGLVFEPAARVLVEEGPGAGRGVAGVGNELRS